MGLRSISGNLGSDILAHPSSSDANGVVTDEAKDAVMQRVSHVYPPE